MGMCPSITAGSRTRSWRSSKRSTRHEVRNLEGPSPKKAKSLAKEARATLDKLDDQGRWVSGVTGDRMTGQPKFGDVRVYLSSEVFSENLEELATFVEAAGQ